MLAEHLIDPAPLLEEKQLLNGRWGSAGHATALAELS